MPAKVATEEPTYASVTDVQALAPTRKLGQGNNPSGADVRIMLEMVEAEINAILVNKGYSVPISKTLSPLAFQFLRRLTAQGAVAQLEASSGNGPNIERTAAIYAASLKSLSDAREIMDAALNVERAKPRGPGITTGLTPETIPTVGPEVNPTSPLTPYFRRGMQF